MRNTCRRVRGPGLQESVGRVPSRGATFEPQKATKLEAPRPFVLFVCFCSKRRSIIGSGKSTEGNEDNEEINREIREIREKKSTEGNEAGSSKTLRSLRLLLFKTSPHNWL